MSMLNPRGVILKLLLASETSELTARDAVTACSLLGIRENSTRVALVRLASAELVVAAGRGTYRLGPKATGLAAEVSSWRAAEQRTREWKGAWVAIHSGALSRTDRAALRARERAIGLLGFRELARDLHVRPDNLGGGVAALRERLHALDPDFEAIVFVARDFDTEHDQRARKLWNGKALNKSYVETRRKLDDWLARAEQLELDVAARESFLVGDKAIRQLVFDPLLPAPLVDVEARRALREAVLRFDRYGRGIWRQFGSAYEESATLAH